MNENQAELLPIIKKYFDNPVNKGFDLTQLKAGSINETYKLKINKKPYILQKINRNIFEKEVIEDMIEVTDFLSKNDISVPHLISTKTKSKANSKPAKKYTLNDKQEIFRIYEYLYGDTPNKFEMSNNNLKTLGVYIANLHQTLKKLDYEPKHKIENFHNTKFYIEKIKTLITNYEIEDQEIIHAMIDTYDKLDKEFLNQKQLIHGDPRIENILYDKKLNEFSMIDFDTVMKESIYVDIGDLCRSLFISEDLDEISYKRQLHEKFIIGYYFTISKNKNKSEIISKQEFISNCINATLLISLELSIRFFIDVIEDNYFGYNPEKFESRKQHNLIRAQNCYELFRIIYKDNF